MIFHDTKLASWGIYTTHDVILHQEGVTELNKENTEKLVKDFPNFWRYADNLMSSLMAFGFECDDGWAPLIYQLCEDIQAKLDESDENLKKHFYVVQVKEKFAGLRFYVSSASKEIFNLITEAEKKSYETCEKCGAVGSVKIKGGWYKTLCEACAGDVWVDAKW